MTIDNYRQEKETMKQRKTTIGYDPRRVTLFISFTNTGFLRPPLLDYQLPIP